MKFSVIGFCFWIVAGVLFVFKAISAAVPTVDIHIFTINELAGVERVTGWVDRIPWPSIQEYAFIFADTNISIILLAVGLIFILIGVFQKN